VYRGSIYYITARRVSRSRSHVSRTYLIIGTPPLPAVSGMNDVIGDVVQPCRRQDAVKREQVGASISDVAPADG